MENDEFSCTPSLRKTLCNFNSKNDHVIQVNAQFCVMQEISELSAKEDRLISCNASVLEKTKF